MTQFILEQGPQETDPGSIYGRTDIFEVPQRGYIKMMFLKITVRTNAPTVPKGTTPAFELHEYITLDSEGVPFCFDNHVYSQCRLSQLTYDNFSQVKAAATITGTFNTATPKTVIRPLFFTAFDNGNKILAKEGLTVRAVTRSDYASMGFDRNITGMDVRLKIMYEQVQEYIERPLMNTYNVRAFPSIELPLGSTSYSLKLKCPFKVISLMFMIKNNAMNYKIESVQLTYPNGEYGLYENNTDFDLTSTGSMEHNDSTYIVSFGSRTDSNQIRMNGDKNPTIANLTFGVTGIGAVAGTRLHYVIEYHSTLEYSDDRIVELIKDSTL